MNARPLRRFLTTSSVAAAFASLVDTLAEPTGDGFLDLSAAGSGRVPEYLELWPIGLGADNDAFNIRVIGISRLMPPAADGRYQWVPFMLAQVGVVVSANVGVAGGIVLPTERYADTITVTTEGTITSDVTRGGTLIVTSPGSDLKANVCVPLRGVEKVGLLFARVTGTPAMNALYSLND